MYQFHQNETIVVIDFETTGMNPEQGDRVIEIGAVTIRDDRITGHFESLIRPDFLITREIEQLTGINNAMLRDAAPATEVMQRFVQFIGSSPLVAHNASFDQKFLESELRHVGKPRPLNFGCTLQLTRRIYPDLINYKLETLIRYKNISGHGQFHRALADAQMTAQLWLAIIQDLKQQYGFDNVPFSLLKTIGKTSKEKVSALLLDAAKNAQQNQVDTTGHLFG